MRNVSGDGPKLQRHMASVYSIDEAGRKAWYKHWLAEGFATLEALLRRREKPTAFCYDEKPTIGDLCLVPQIYNAVRAGLDMSDYPLVSELDERCRALPEFDKAMPQNRPEYPGEG